MTPSVQERHHDYVLGPNQDSRLASVAAGQLIKGVRLDLDADAPFALRGRAVRQKYAVGETTVTQNGLQFLKVRWAGPTTDYRQQDLVLESLSMANFGQFGNPKPIVPQVVYPANGFITLDLENTGTSAIHNLTFYWRGVKLYPWGTVPAYTYPDRFSGLPFIYRQSVAALAPTETRLDQLFTIRPDADFVLRSGQFTAPFVDTQSGDSFAEVFIRLKDFNYKPYSNDFVALDVLFGSGGPVATIPLGGSPSFPSPLVGTGPAQPGLLYPELYVPANHQLLFDLQRNDSGSTASEDFIITWMGQKVFQKVGR